MLQAVQTDQPNVSDHLMFEVGGVFSFHLHCMLCKKKRIFICNNVPLFLFFYASCFDLGVRVKRGFFLKVMLKL